MLVESLISAIDDKSPPFQPFLMDWAGSYRERVLAWNPQCIKRNGVFYQFRTESESWAMPILPDACMNVLFELSSDGHRAMLCGVRTKDAMLVTKPNCTYFGFKPYTYMGIRSDRVSCAELVNTSAQMNEVFPGVDEMIEKLRAAEDFDARVRLVYHYARDVMVDYSYSPSLAEYLAVTICTAEGNAELGLLDSMMGYSSRYVRDVFKQNYGITPKKYSNIMRFQNALRLLATGKYNNRLSSLATEAGYYDQSHLIRSFKEYAAISPLEFLRLLEGSTVVKETEESRIGVRF